jgi:hypothetical protein
MSPPDDGVAPGSSGPGRPPAPGLQETGHASIVISTGRHGQYGRYGYDCDDETAWTPSEPPPMFESRRIPQAPTVLIVGLGAVAVISNFAFQGLFPAGAPTWLPAAIILAVAAIAALSYRSE